MVVKISFQNKGYKSKNKNRASAIIGDLFIKYEIINNNVFIKGGQLILKEGTEFNEHQQSTFSLSKGLRKEFSKKFKIEFNNIEKKKLHLMNTEQLKWWNEKLKTFGSFLLISRYLTGNNPTGSEQVKKNAEFILNNSQCERKPFFNLLKVFTEKSELQAYDFNYLYYENFDQFLNKVSNVSNQYKDIINRFYNNKFKYFYIDEERHYLKREIKKIDKEQRLRNKFRNKLISTYGRTDQFYKIFKSRKMVEAAHIKPVKHSIDKNDDEIEDINNGLLLSPDIHKLFDSGLITFDSENGKVIYKKNNKNSLFYITTKEIERLKLNDFYLDHELLTSKRIKYLKYHKQEVFQKGI